MRRGDDAVDQHSDLPLSDQISHGLNLLSKVVDHISGQASLEETLAKSLALACQLVGASAGWIFLKNDEGEFELAATHGLPPALTENDNAALRTYRCDCQRKLLAGDFSPLVSLVPCRRLKAAKGETWGLNQHATIFLHRDGEKLGVVNMAFPGGDRPFSDAEQSILDTIGQVLSMVVQRHRCIRQSGWDDHLPEPENTGLTSRQYELILQSAAEGIVSVDRHGNITLINDAAARMFGSTPEKLMNRPIHHLIHPAGLPSTPCGDENCPLFGPINFGTSQRSDDYIFRRMDGTGFPVEFTSTPLWDGGIPSGVVIVFNDITEKKNLQQQRERLFAIIEESPEIISSSNKHGHVIYSNVAARRQFGNTPVDVHREPWSHLSRVHPQWARELIVKEGIPSAARDGVWRGETAIFDRNGQEVPVLQTIVAHKNEQGEVEYFSTIIVDISQRKSYEQKLVHLATHDQLTGLLNRTGFQQELDGYLTGAAGNFPAALLYFDIDNIKDVNDTCGHGVGDMLLKRFASVLRDTFRTTDVIARMGGDEFAVFMPRATLDTAQKRAREFLGLFHTESVYTDQGAVRATVSIGVAAFPDHGVTIEELLMHADLAMYEAKRAGGNRVALFSPGMKAKKEITARINCNLRLRRALEEDRLHLYRQPIVDLSTGRPVFYELLLRMEEPNGIIVGPNAFLSMASVTGMMREIDLWVVRQAIRTVQRAGAYGPDSVRLSVNVSGRTFSDEQFVRVLIDELERSSVDPRSLIFEITEHVAIDNLSHTHKHILQLQSLGCSFALDDFGVGYACFDLLKRLPVELVKVDGNFVKNLAKSEVDQRVIKAIVGAAQGVGARTVAEYVENAETLKLLKQIGVDFAQGFYLGRPEPTP